MAKELKIEYRLQKSNWRQQLEDFILLLLLYHVSCWRLKTLLVSLQTSHLASDFILNGKVSSSEKQNGFSNSI